jgi:hypothetical protein
MAPATKCRLALFSGTAFTIASTALAATPTSTLTVVATSNIGNSLAPKIHLYQIGTSKDFWPATSTQIAHDIPVGYYRIEVSLLGYRSFRRELEVSDENTSVRVVLTPSGEATGPAELKGTVLHVTNYTGLWVLAFPLTGSPSDMTESPVAKETGRFRITTAHPGSYILVVVRGDRVLASQQADIGFQNPELTIDLRE